MTRDEAEKLLDVAPNVGPEMLKAAWRRYAQAHHPDRTGGNAVAFHEGKKAYELLRDAPLQTTACSVCNGTGWATARKGFYEARVPCLTCKGTGKITRR